VKFNYYYLLVGLSLFIACNAPTEKVEDNTMQKMPEVFVGHVRYEIEVVSSDSADVTTFFTFSPRSIDIWMGDSTFRMVEHGGVSRGNIAIDLRKSTAYQIDTLQRKVFRGAYSDFNNASEDLQRLMPDHYRPVLQSTGKQKTIRGLACTEYQVIRSGFTRPEANTVVWVSNDISLPSSRFDIETSVNRVTSPLPMYMGVQEGTVVELIYQIDGMEVRYSMNIISTEPKPAAFFEPPTEYTLE
jgi:hypothetical protein